MRTKITRYRHVYYRMVNFSSTLTFIQHGLVIFYTNVFFRRRNRNCPRSDPESNGDHWCCDVKTKNTTMWDFFLWPCDEMDALQEENGGENPPENQMEWSEHSRKRRSGDHG